MNTKIIRGCSFVLAIPIYLVAAIIPKDPKLWVFGAWFGRKFSDHPKALFDYIEKTGDEIDTLWIAKDPHLVKELQKNGIWALRATSIAGMWYQARAGAAIFTHSIQADFAPFCISGRTKRILLWHGIPLKRIGYDGHLSADSTLKKVLKKTIFRFLQDHVDLVCAASSNIADIYARAFAVPRSKVAVTGGPNSDLVLASRHKKKPVDEPLRILYAPTFRNGQWQELDFFGTFINKVKALDICLQQHKLKLAIRLHPVNHPTDETQKIVSASKHMYFEDADELNEIIWKYDALITDFSGVMFDFSLLKRPVYFLPIDIKTYLSNERELYVDYDSFTKDSRIDNWESFQDDMPQIVKRLRNGAANGNPNVSEYGIHFYDGKNSERVYLEITKLFSNERQNDFTQI